MGGRGTSEITQVEMMKYMGWSYQELMDTPVIIVDTIQIRMSLEAKASKKNGK